MTAASPTAGRTRPRRRITPTSRERWFYLFVAPWLVGLVVFQVAPIAGAVALAFADWRPPLPVTWVGLDNLAAMATDPRLGRALANTLVYAVATVVPGLAIGLGLALLLRGVRRGGTLLRGAVFLPAVLSGVATALAWAWLLNPRFGLVNELLGFVGIRGPAWLQDGDWALASIVLIGLWNVGVNVIVYLAGLNAVPRDLLEAAAIDGAGRAGRFRHVIWPALTPVTFYLVVVNAIGAVQAFTPAYVLTSGGPSDATLTLGLYTYQAAFADGRLGYASAIAVGTVVLLVGLAALLFRTAGRRVTYGGEA